MYIISPTKEGPVRGAVPGLVGPPAWRRPYRSGLPGLGLIVLSMGGCSPFFLQASVDSKVPLEFRQLGYYLLWLPGLASSSSVA